MRIWDLTEQAASIPLLQALTKKDPVEGSYLALGAIFVAITVMIMITLFLRVLRAFSWLGFFVIELNG